jgi:hypothetical protein
MKFFLSTLYSFVIWIVVFGLFYGAHALIGNAKPIERDDFVFFGVMGLFLSLTLAFAGSRGWLSKRK